MDLSPSAEEIDVAIHMGFGSFGAQSATKKRKHNPAGDAITTAREKQPKGILQSYSPHLHKDDANNGSLPRSTATDAGSGTENPLAVLRTQGETFSQGKTASLNSSMAMDVRGKQEKKDCDNPSYVRKTPPASSPVMTSMAPLSIPTMISKESASRTEEISLLEHPHLDPVLRTNDLQPTGPSPEKILISRNEESEGRDLHHDWAALKRGVQDARGDVAYYDKSFIEDPWQELRSRPRWGH